MARTLDDIAALSGVSRATVSRVLNGGPVSPETEQRVRVILEQTNFRPNTAARTLASGRSGVVGVVLHVDPHRLFGDRYFSQLLQGISDVLAERSVGMMLWLGNRSKEETLERIQAMSLLDAVIVTAHNLDDPLVDGLLASRLPTVLVGHRSADRSASYVDIDNLHAADQLTTHLVKIGRTRIGHVTGERGTFAAEDRIRGYRRALERAGLSDDGRIVDGDYTIEAGAAGAEILLDRGCRRDLLRQRLGRTRGPGRDPGARSARTGGRRPRRVRRPRLRGRAGSTADHGPSEHPGAGRGGGDESARQLLEDPAGAPRRVVLPTELVIRRSTAGGLERRTGGG